MKSSMLYLLIPAVTAFTGPTLLAQSRGAPPQMPCFDANIGAPRGLSQVTPLPWGKGTLKDLPNTEKNSNLKGDAHYWEQVLRPCPGAGLGKLRAPDLPPATARFAVEVPTSGHRATLAPGTPLVALDGLLPNPGRDEIPGGGSLYCQGGRGATSAIRRGFARAGIVQGQIVADPGIPMKAGAPLNKPECLVTTQRRQASSGVTVRARTGITVVPQLGRPEVLKFPHLVVPPPPVQSANTQGPEILLPPLLARWGTTCAEGMRRYDQWFAGQGVPRDPAGEEGMWVAGWGSLALAEWRLTCAGGVVTEISATLSPHDARREGATELGQSVRRWMARVAPVNTVMTSVGGDSRGHTPAVTTYRVPVKGPSGTAKLYTSGIDPVVRLVWFAPRI